MMRRFIIPLLIFAVILLTSCNASTQPPPPTQPPKQKQASNCGNRIVLGWNAFGTTEKYIEQNNTAPSLNVVSPSWFRLEAEQFVQSSVDPKYIRWAHQSGHQVWPLFGNRFDPELTHLVLSNTKKREKLIHRLRDILVHNDIDGINVDFENIDIKDKKIYVSFIRELQETLHPHGILVSVDVSRENPDPFWSGSFDRHELGKAADYIIMMGYDEDLGGGGRVSSVASLPWVEKGIQLLLRDVPARKVILAVPFYTRDWVTDLKTKKTEQKDLTLIEVKKIIADKGLKKKWDPQSKQNVIEYTEENKKHQIWVEDEQSMQQRLGLVDQYKLRGTAIWFIGQESPEIWDVFRK
ncbi:glycosyl hydrolase family 18 protein [Paenibacillus terrigena]|uniref:glycosyl hydrolase family 18 protein n=1 Tax=Paenibacillus terrigena TaxID=369333 RepID=UPI00037025F9|nr:glycosyl hydrolase family 18 protein [Paenibacillus terrigena]